MARPIRVTTLAAVGDKIVSSRLLVLQSKRLLLNSANARHLRTGDDQAKLDGERLETEVQHAHHTYNETVLQWGSPQSPQYRLVAFTSLIAKGERLRREMRSASSDALRRDRSEVLADLRDLDSIIDGWRQIARTAMKATVA